MQKRCGMPSIPNLVEMPNSKNDDRNSWERCYSLRLQNQSIPLDRYALAWWPDFNVMKSLCKKDVESYNLMIGPVIRREEDYALMACNSLGSDTEDDFNRQAVLTSAAMKVNTVTPIVNRVSPITVFHKTHSPFLRPFNNTTALRTKFSKQKVNTAKVNAVNAVGGKRETTVKPSVDLPYGKKTIGTKWVYQNKKDERGVVGLQVKQKADGIFISQDKYVTEILKKFDFVNVKTASTPIKTQKPLVKDEEASDVDVYLYRSMIGSLMYLTASRPDIMFAVCACSRLQVTPKTSYLSVVKRIFRYLKGKPKLGLWYPRVSLFDLESYLDSDYAGANLDRKSTTGGCQFLGRRLISWQCKKQTIVATSTTEAKYVAAANCCG
ncbi:hypothetical protein Tco_1446664 [Tanacetum coccineum]